MKQGWEIKKLGEVCDFQNGFAFQSKTYKESGLPILRITNIQNDEIDTKELVYFETKDYKVNLDRFKVYQGDLLIAMSGATTGKLGINNSETVFYLNQRVGKFIPKKEILKPYLYFYLSTKVEESLRIAAGAAQPNLSTEQINNFEIPLPSLPEQQRIVAILDEAFAAIAKAKANAEQNLKNAKELFGSYLQGVFEKKGKDWEEKALGEIADVEYGYTDKSTGEGDYRYVRITDIDKNGELILEDKKYIKYSKEAEGFLIQDNDLLMARTGATFAKVLLYKNYEPSVFASYLIRIKFFEKIENELYWHFTKTKYYWEQANSLSSGAAQPHFNGAAVKQVIFSYPKSVEEQKKVIEKFRTLSTEIKKLEIIYLKKLNDIEDLKKAVLQKAFSGELKASIALV
ncbi:MAG: hypothetical protein FGM41_03000 [Bacteroidetes bacterium]|nr:hypothetical protein [Bacteroidota bacterium]